jgi:CheY-like chemotaxis protein
MPVSTANGVKASVVLEDEFFLRFGIVNALREAGYSVIECGSGEQAVALCRSKAPIDVLFTDINLGGSVSGWEVAERFRKDRPDGAVLYTSGDEIDPKHRRPSH